MIEEWRDIYGYKGLYQVSSEGRVKSFQRCTRGRLLKPGKTKYGYLMVSLCKDGKCKTITIHRLVASAFLHKPKGSTEVNHKDENKLNNRASNLEWCTREYNNEYSLGRIYLFKSPNGEKVEVNNLSKFCREKNLDKGGMQKVASGERPSCKGYTAWYGIGDSSYKYKYILHREIEKTCIIDRSVNQRMKKDKETRREARRCRSNKEQ
jgi:hypothetical protein